MRFIPRHIHRTGLGSVFLLFGLPLCGHAQEATALQTALSQCHAITSVAARVDCYDALARAQQPGAAQPPTAPSAARITTQPPTPPAAPSASTATPAPVSARPASASVTAASEPAPVAEFDQEARVETSDGEEAEFTDTVSAVKRVEPTKLQISLTNGQIWRQSVGKSFPVREGETVHIRASGWGRDYRLSVDGRPGYIQVSRQR